MFQWLQSLFGPKSPEEIRLEQRRQQTLASLAQGGIPLDARLEREAARGDDFFSSTLTAREYLLAKHSGVKVIGPAMGSSFFNVSFNGMQQRQRRQTGEMVDLSQAQLDSRSVAMSRMRQEAELLGASGVIGVKMKSTAHNWASRLTEFTAIGTAVKIPGWTGKPFTSALSAQEFWQLYQAGYVPVDVAMGVCSYYMYTDQATRDILYSFWGNNRKNLEVPLYTDGLQYAREKAMDRVTDDLNAHQAEGVVGMDVTYNMEHVEYDSSNTTYHDLIAHFVALGTSVVYRPELVKTTTQPVSNAARLILDLAAKRKARHGMVSSNSLEGHTAATRSGHTA